MISASFFASKMQSHPYLQTGMETHLNRFLQYGALPLRPEKKLTKSLVAYHLIFDKYVQALDSIKPSAINTDKRSGSFFGIDLS